MSIKGLTDRNLAFPEIGQIRKGAPKNEKGWVGKELPYFRVEFDEKETSSAAEFIRVYTDKPSEIGIVFPFNEIERVWDAWLECYTAGRMVARSDGDRYLYLVDTKTSEIIIKDGKEVKTGAMRPYVEGQPAGFDDNGKPLFCKPTGRLKVVVPELRRLAYLTVHTTSVHDIVNISSQLEAIRQVNGGQIAGVPLVLRRRPREISTPTKEGKRVRMTKYLVSIEADPQWVKAKLSEMKRLALPGNGMIEHNETPQNPAEAAYIPDADEQDDVYDGEWEQEQEQEKVNQAEEKKTEPEKQTAKPERPYSPDKVREGIIFRANQNGKPASEKQRQLLVITLNKIFEGDEEKRRQVQVYLTSKSSAKEMDNGYVQAMLDWLNPTQDSGGDYLPNEMAAREAIAIYNYRMSQNQLDLFEEAHHE